MLFLGGPDQITSAPSEAPFLPLYLITVSGPFITGILLTIVYSGKQGLRELISRLFKWRLPAKWYAVAFLLVPLCVFVPLFVLSVVSPIYMPGIFSPGTNPIASAFGLEGSDKVTLIMFVFMIGLFNGFVEEVGWTGFATPRLMVNHNFMKAGITLGIMWGLWHLLSNFIGSKEGAGSVSLFLFLPVMLFSFLPPFRILMMWVYRHTGSLWMAIVIHAILDVCWLLSMPVAITGKERVIWYVLWAVVLWCIVIVLSVVDSKRKDIGIAL